MRLFAFNTAPSRVATQVALGFFEEKVVAITKAQQSTSNRTSHGISMASCARRGGRAN
jgi:hypothetical protein